jgi:chorismate mutase
MIEKVRNAIAEVTAQVVRILIEGRGHADLDPWLKSLAYTLSERYGVEPNWFLPKMTDLLSPFSLSFSDLEELKRLLLCRCDLSLQIAEMKRREFSHIPQSRDELVRALTRPKVEEEVVEETVPRSQEMTEPERLYLTETVRFLFELSKQIQANHLMRLQDETEA